MWTGCVCVCVRLSHRKFYLSAFDCALPFDGELVPNAYRIDTRAICDFHFHAFEFRVSFENTWNSTHQNLVRSLNHTKIEDKFRKELLFGLWTESNHENAIIYYLPFECITDNLWARSLPRCGMPSCKMRMPTKRNVRKNSKTRKIRFASQWLRMVAHRSIFHRIKERTWHVTCSRLIHIHLTTAICRRQRQDWCTNKQSDFHAKMENFFRLRLRRFLLIVVRVFIGIFARKWLVDWISYSRFHWIVVFTRVFMLSTIVGIAAAAMAKAAAMLDIDRSIMLCVSVSVSKCGVLLLELDKLRKCFTWH